MAIIIDGRKLAEKIKDNIVKEIIKLGDNKRPNLAIILIGERKDSKLYVDLKEKEAKKVGIDTHVYRCLSDTPEPEIFEMIDCLNKDDLIDAILVQLPLPIGFDTDGIILAIDPAKDVDRFHPNNLELLFKTCNHKHVLPPVYEAVLEILSSINYKIKNSRACIITNSNIFGKGMAKVLDCLGAECDMASAGNMNFKNKIARADILITAVGKKHFIKKDMIKKDAVIIDIGIIQEGNKINGDVDFNNVKNKAAYITPVPGGVGPMTIAMLFKNTLALHNKRLNNKYNSF
ncbi:MAG: bifunctional 5,10-methylenetetrahydrofolate dehydrogenase/5,10-methenyltetrahydrofolate cyclohydrolase [Patescibacteria group bacterium]|nr:bifunctional 5,10-methylenetetrahydrofolate dehydrogenase/5,10-methenyltetrahydrofolate cyclohydrolase [Patescibacteria group bacterium]